MGIAVSPHFLQAILVLAGNLNPSKTDVSLTRKIRMGGEILDIVVLDHLIISSEGGILPIV